MCLYDVENVVHSTENNVRCKRCLKMIETNKAESKDATQDKIEDFNEDTCDLFAYEFKTFFRPKFFSNFN